MGKMRPGFQARERAHFDAIAEQSGDIWWGHHTDAGRARMARRGALCSDFLRGAQTHRVLELGCGAGTFTAELSTRLPDLDLLAVDISPHSIEAARARLEDRPGLTLKVLDLLDPDEITSLGETPFDAIVGNSVLHHLPIEELLPVLYGLLRPGGVLWFSEPNLLNPQVAAEKTIRPIGALLQNTEDETAFFRWRLVETIDRHGFVNTRVRPYDFMHPALPSPTLDLLRSAERILERTPLLREFSGSLLIDARRPPRVSGASTTKRGVPETRSAFETQETRRKAARLSKLEACADRRDTFRSRHSVYYDEIEKLARFRIPPGQRVLEIGCSTGDLLAALAPSHGVGLDLSPTAITRAREKHPELHFTVADIELLDPETVEGAPFDWIVMSDVVGYLDDVWAAFRNLRTLMGPETKLFLTWYNYLWEPLIEAGERLGWKMPVPAQNWLTQDDIENLLALAGLQPTVRGTANLFPGPVPLLARAINRVLAPLPGVRQLCLQRFLVARAMPKTPDASKNPTLTCSVVVPCKNEEGNINAIFDRVPEMGAGTELIFVDGSSSDKTVEAIETRLASRPNTRLLHQGSGVGKGDAVRKGFAAATGEVLFILDADLTVPPEDLPKFYLAIAEGHGEFINGSRLVYPMEGDAMRLLNTLGNKFFGVAFTTILDQRIKDTLCGTKVLTRQNYARIAAGRDTFGLSDPFGDFDLLFGAARLGLRIIELPVRYRRRTYGDTKIDRFRHGLILLRMTAFAARKFKLT